jgi:glycosyltransferase involved in cell wall biosynthesis
VLVSIIIDNYNYGRYLAQAIDSALRQAGQPVEVIVVDDGSTDDSQAVIESFGDRITGVFKANGGQASAINAGFSIAQGQAVIFLDADDVLLPIAAARAAAVFTAQPNTAKVQYRMRVIDEQGREQSTLGAAHIPLQSGDLRRQEVSFPFDLPWAGMSANAYAADVLRRILPMPTEPYGRAGADWYLAHVAALFGEVCALDEVCALYRMHGANEYASAGRLDLDTLRQSIRYAAATQEPLRRFADALHIPRPDPILSVSDVASRIASRKLDAPRHPLRGDTVAGLIGLGIRAAGRRFDIHWPMKLMFMAWFLAMGLAPRPVARALATGFFVPESRQALNQWLGRLHRGARP